MFNIPIVLFIFKRKDSVFKIIDQISKVKPQKIYLISDGPRNSQEKNIVLDVRSSIENYINWDCEIIKNYSDINRGVYNRIGEGAKWVFSLEEKAIFLEDDNLPESTFFKYCEDLLTEYKTDTRVLWICGTNYLGEYLPNDSSSYMFTQHLLPCGWASWSDKFLKFYDGELELLSQKDISKRLFYEYENKSLFKQEILLAKKTKNQLNKNKKLASWDRQMMFSLRVNGLFGISPKYNQIKNIGVDEHSVHGGHSINNEMTSRFCEIETKKLEFPLKHPKIVLKDYVYEAKIAKIILYPLKSRILINIMTLIKPLIGLNKYDSFRTILRKKFKKVN